jgi:hypothetical protein
MFLSFTMHICIMYGLPVPCAMTSSKDVVAYEDNAIGIPAFAAALEVASSPSLCARQCIALGLKPQGKVIFLPKISALVSTLETFRKIRGRILYLSYAVTFSRSLMSSVTACVRHRERILTLSCPWHRRCNTLGNHRTDSLSHSAQDRESRKREDPVLVDDLPLLGSVNACGRFPQLLDCTFRIKV